VYTHQNKHTRVMAAGRDPPNEMYVATRVYLHSMREMVWRG
jgi:hypothetical protein